MKSLLLNQYSLGVFAVLISLILLIQLPSPAFDVCAFGSDLGKNHWYYCGGGHLFLSGSVFAFALFLLGPNSKWYRAITILLLILLGLSETISAGAPNFSGLLSWLFSPIFGGSIFGALLGFYVAKVIRCCNAKFSAPNK